MPKIAVAQIAPAVLDRDACLAKVVSTIEEAALAGAKLVVFPETFVPGYPTWAWRLRPGGDMALATEIHARLLESSIDVEADGLKAVRDAARSHGVTVSLGFHEREGSFSRSTLYNSNALISHEGELLNLHRKMMPTNPERMIHGVGDARGLRVVETPVGRVGALICWESYMPLARFALYAQGIDLYLAPTWDSGDAWQSTLKHIAREGGCYVAGVASCLYARDVPADFPGRAQLFPDDQECINPGRASVFAPGGQCIAEPVGGEERLLLVDVDPRRAAEARRSLDAAGHYNRPDLFRLDVDRGAQEPVRFTE